MGTVHRRQLLAAGLAAPALCFGALPVLARGPSLQSTNGLAIGGADVLAYFEYGDMRMGKPQHALRWMGAIWQFSSAEHLTRFEMDPRRFAPQYCGHCAMGMYQGVLLPGDNTAFCLYEERLFLLNNTAYVAPWKKGVDEMLPKANANWARLQET